MKRFAALLLAVMMLLATVSAFADSELEYVKANGKLVVGVTDFAPMDYKDEAGNWIGIDADLAVAFAKTLGVDVEFIEIDWDNKILELNAKSIDCVWNGMTLTDEVMSAMGCTDAYMNNAQVVVMDATKLDAMPDELDASAFDGMTFAVEAGSAGEEVANEIGMTTTPVTSQAAALMEVAAGTSDAAVIDFLMAAAMVGEGTGYPSLSYDYPLNDEQYGIGFRTGSDLVEACNAFLAEAANDGTLEALIIKYMGE